MELIYRAWDGTEFRERSACERYEYNTPCIPMWNDNGKTKNVDEALVVFLRDDKATQHFVRMCENEGSPYTGIEFDKYRADTGVFVWNYNTEQYDQIDCEVEQALRHCFNEYHSF